MQPVGLLLFLCSGKLFLKGVELATVDTAPRQLVKIVFRPIP